MHYKACTVMEPDFKGICASKAADVSECALDTNI